MSKQLQIQIKSGAMQVLKPPRPGFLQRKCGCGGSLGPRGECVECSKDNLSLQRATRKPKLETPNSGAVPPIVHEVLRSPGQPLDSATRAFMESRFGHDFSQARVNSGMPMAYSNLTMNDPGDEYEREADKVVKQALEGTPSRTEKKIQPPFGYDFSQVHIHTDVKAAESAQAINALAYTVGRDIVFGAGQYSPHSTQGRRLLTHELAHVVQQGKSFGIRAEVKLMRDVAVSEAANLLPPLDYKRIADQIHEAIAGLGTDEEAVYRALQKLGRNQTAIDELKRVYLKEHKVPLLDDIYDDFSGTELEYALQLLNMGAPGSKQRVEPAPKIPVERDARCNSNPTSRRGDGDGRGSHLRSPAALRAKHTRTGE